MRIFLLTAVFLTFQIFCSGQTYIALAPSINNQAGSFAEKVNLNLEVGRQWDVFSLGIVVGKNSLANPAPRRRRPFDRPLSQSQSDTAS